MSEMTKLELMELFNLETPQKVTRLKKINAEFKTRLDEITRISEVITRGEVRGVEEIDSLTADLENHRDRCVQIKREVDIMMFDFTQDLRSINE
tara:strand:+ start:2033 stop:2314 length:282 start_codon:yes stop_codon:yes gene_type:complete